MLCKNNYTSCIFCKLSDLNAAQNTKSFLHIQEGLSTRPELIVLSYRGPGNETAVHGTKYSIDSVTGSPCNGYAGRGWEPEATHSVTSHVPRPCGRSSETFCNETRCTHKLMFVNHMQALQLLVGTCHMHGQ